VSNICSKNGRSAAREGATGRGPNRGGCPGEGPAPRADKEVTSKNEGSRGVRSHAPGAWLDRSVNGPATLILTGVDWSCKALEGFA
jgi:hypothetical protein